jgi:hypothetical protein
MHPSNTVDDVMNGIVRRLDAHPHPLMTPPLNQKTSRQILSENSGKPSKNLNKRETSLHRPLLPHPSHNTFLKHRRKRHLGPSPEKIDLPNFVANQKLSKRPHQAYKPNPPLRPKRLLKPLNRKPWSTMMRKSKTMMPSWSRLRTSV